MEVMMDHLQRQLLKSHKFRNSQSKQKRRKSLQVRLRKHSIKWPRVGSKEEMHLLNL
jgi:hypothetical protein